MPSQKLKFTQRKINELQQIAHQTMTRICPINTAEEWPILQDVEIELQIKENIATKHTNHENLIKDISISESQKNYFANQIFTKKVGAFKMYSNHLL